MSQEACELSRNAGCRPLRIALVINKIDRELRIMEKIRDWLQAIEPETKVLIIDFHEELFHVSVIRFAPDIVLTFPFTAVPLSLPFLLIKWLVGCQIVCFRTEGAINFNSPEQLKWHVGMDTYSAEFVDFECFWGGMTAKLVGQKLVEQGKLSGLQRIKVFGYPNLENYFPEFSHDSAVLPEYIESRLSGVSPSSVVFAISGFHFADYTEQDILKAGDWLRLDDPNFEIEYEKVKQGALKVRNFRALWTAAVLRAASENPSAVFLVKCHPIEVEIWKEKGGPDPYQDLKSQHNIIYIAENIPIASLISRSGLFVHYGSTSVVESYLLRVPAVFVSSYEVYGDGSITAASDLNDFGWPSTRRADLSELADLVKEHLAEPISFNNNQEQMEHVLEGVFNIKKAHLERLEPYQPSRDIAEFLLELRDVTGQAFKPNDSYVHDALTRYGHMTFSRLLSRTREDLEQNRLLSALQGINQLSLLGSRIGVDTSGFVYVKARILIQAGCYHAAIVLLQESIAVNPDEEAIALLDQLNHSGTSACEDVSALQADIAAFSGNVDSLVNVGISLINAGHTEIARLLCLLMAVEEPIVALPLFKTLYLYYGDDAGLLGCFSDFPEDLAELAVLKKQFEEWSPKVFMIETALACDLHCPECAIGGKLIARKHRFMNFEQFKVLADKIRPSAEYLLLHIWGEPLLNPDILQMIRYAATFTKINISTNGMGMNDTFAEELILSGVSDLIVSIDGVTQEIYGQYRVGGDVEKVLSALVMLQKHNMAHGGRVRLLPQFIVFKHNQHEMQQFAEYCHSIGLEPFFKAPYLRPDSKFQLSDHPEYRRASYSNQMEQMNVMRGCPDARRVMTVLVDGSVVVCCYDHDGVTCTGNLFEQGLEEIWQGKRSRFIRWQIAVGNAPQFCTENCLTYSRKRGAAAIVKSTDSRSVEDRNMFMRTKYTVEMSGLENGVEAAEECYAAGRFQDAFDLYEQLLETYPAVSVPLMARLYDLYATMPDSENRYYLYVSRYFDFNIKSYDKVLDIGSGHLPFPFATHLADLAPDDASVGRAGIPFKQLDGKPVFQCNVENLPFADKEFDFIYCSHVLEHVESPEKACRELIRVGKRGYIETPSPSKDLWLNTAGISNHRWGVTLSNGNTLQFVEYTKEDIDGLGCGILLGMHCAPQSEREKAFSALVNLKADKLNTMLYWEGNFTFEVHRCLPVAVESVPASIEADQPTDDKRQSVSLPSCVFINTYYSGFIKTLYADHPGLALTSYGEQHRALQQAMFGDSDFYSCGLKDAGWSATELIINCEPLQQTWAAENGCSANGMNIAIEQILRIKPDVLYIQDMHVITDDFLRAIRSSVRLIAGQIASPFGSHIPLDSYDLMVTSFPHFVDRFRQMGKIAWYQPLAFEPRVLDEVRSLPFVARPIECSFVGGISGLHTAGTVLLEKLVDKTPIRIWGYGATGLPKDSAIRQRHQGEVWGKDMFAVLASSRITVNRHVDVAENNANNMRLFEATGCGALLITDYKDNLHELFEIGREVVVYRSPEECADLVNYYLARPEEAEAIAKAGQQRTLSEHSYCLRMKQTAEFLGRSLRYREEDGKFILPERVSSDYRNLEADEEEQSLTQGWRSADIPVRQRGLVQYELARMYRGDIPAPFFVLSDMLKPFASTGMKILELGCASGYYYEVLEYLLGKRIEFTGVDYSEAMIEMARDYYPAASFFAADARCLFFADRSFDVVVSSSILLHVPNYREHLEETIRVAADLLVLHRTPVCRRSGTRRMVKKAYGVETLELRFNESEILNLVLQAGFELIDAREIDANLESDEYCFSYLLKRVSK